jgi:hypothetical protein
MGNVYVLNLQERKILVLKEMHNVPYVGNLGQQKTIIVFKRQYYWSSMKKEAVDYIAICLECQKFKDENRNLVGLLQPFPILERKWELVTMDFITKLPRNTKQHDSIMVVVDKLTKSVNFILVKLTHKEDNIAYIYMREILGFMVYLRKLCLTDI